MYFSSLVHLKSLPRKKTYIVKHAFKSVECALRHQHKGNQTVMWYFIKEKCDIFMSCIVIVILDALDSLIFS